MELLKNTKESAHIDINREELLIMNSALNEICNGLDIPEFETRIGASIDKAESMLKMIGSILDKMDTSEI